MHEESGPSFVSIVRNICCECHLLCPRERGSACASVTTMATSGSASQASIVRVVYPWTPLWCPAERGGWGQATIRAAQCGGQACKLQRGRGEEHVLPYPCQRWGLHGHALRAQGLGFAAGQVAREWPCKKHVGPRKEVPVAMGWGTLSLDLVCKGTCARV